jgi:Helix-turn-helix domain
MSAAPVVAMPVREAYPSDVAKVQSLSGHEKLVYKVLAEHVYHPKKNKPDQRPYDGIVWLRRATICEETSLSDSTVRRAINKLLAQNWICLPEGDAGGRSKALKYHLHADGCACCLPKPPLKQRQAACGKEPERASICTPFFDLERASICHERPSICSGKGVNLTDAY